MALRDLPTLAEMQAHRRPLAKPSKAERVKDRGDEQLHDKLQLAAMRAACFTRDKGKCRCCKKKVERTLTVGPRQAQCHHITGRATKDVRYDVRNGLTVCLLCHAKIEEHLIVIVGQAKDLFEVNGRKYINGNADLEFVRQ